MDINENQIKKVSKIAAEWWVNKLYIYKDYAHMIIGKGDPISNESKEKFIDELSGLIDIELNKEGSLSIGTNTFTFGPSPLEVAVKNVGLDIKTLPSHTIMIITKDYITVSYPPQHIEYIYITKKYCVEKINNHESIIAAYKKYLDDFTE